MAPAPPRFPASIGCAPGLERARPSRSLQVMRAAATALLLVASASLAALAASAVIVQLRVAAMPPVAQQIQAMQHEHPAPRRARVSVAEGTPLSALGPDTHAVDELWRRATLLSTGGSDVTLVRASLPRAATADVWTNGPGYLRILPEGRGAGLRIVDLDRRSAPALAGVRKGDVITAVNGFPLASPEDGLRAFAGAGEARTLVAELEREGHRIALRVDWQG
jgi:membrane-associated protease RseP (regulator of RpoE activity)